MAMRFNIFRNRNLDAQVGYLMDSYDQAVRHATEQYWRDVIAEEVKDYIWEALSDTEEFYGRGSEYEVILSIEETLISLIKHKKYPPLSGM